MSGVTFQTVATAACKLPEVEISKSYGTPALKVRGKLLARLHEDGETLVLRTEFSIGRSSCRQIPRRSSSPSTTATIHGLMRLAKVSQIGARLTCSSAPGALVAPKTLIAKFDAQRVAAQR